MTGWCSDLSKAPRGRYVVTNRKAGTVQTDVKVFHADRVILATKCGKVITSHYLPEAKRWLGLANGEQPVAWQPWPTHPHSSPSSPRATDMPAGVTSSPPAGNNSAGPLTLAVPGGEPGKPSPHAGGAKMDGPGHPDRPDVKSVCRHAEWGQAANNLSEAS